MLHTRTVAPLGSRTSRVNAPRPFTASSKCVRPAVFLRVAAPEAEPAEAAEDVFEPIVLEEEVQERIELDDDAREALRVAEQLMSTYTLEAVLEAGLEEADDAIRDKAEELLEDGLAASKGSLSTELAAAAVAAVTGEELAQPEDIDDYQGAAGFRKYDEEEEVADIPEETLEAIQRFKLTRNELANLLPKDWDSVNVDWFTSKREDNIPLPQYKLNFLYLKDNIAVSVDQVYARGQVSPLTEYYVWPRKDAWDDLKRDLEARPIVSERDRVMLLNRLTEVINFWQSENQKATPPIDDARTAFPDCSFA